MKFDLRDWYGMRYAIMGLLMALIIVTLLLLAVAQQRGSLRMQLQLQQMQLDQARQRNEASGQEKETIVRNLPLYQRLIETGFVGEERRIEWIDTLRAIHEQYKLFDINYSIASQAPYSSGFMQTGAGNAGSLTLYRSVMTLELAMLHEGDLLTVTEQLTQRQNAPFIVRDCEINRIAKPSPLRLEAYFVANCELDWLTVHTSTEP